MMKYPNKAMRGLISCVGNPYPLFAMATQSHLSTQPYIFKLLGCLIYKCVNCHLNVKTILLDIIINDTHGDFIVFPQKVLFKLVK